MIQQHVLVTSIDDNIKDAEIIPQRIRLSDRFNMEAEAVESFTNLLEKLKIRNLEALKWGINFDNILQVFTVDIHMGHGREEEGYEIIHHLRESYPRALIYAITGHGDREHCIKSGATNSFRKAEGGKIYAKISQEIEEARIIKEFNYLARIVEFDKQKNYILLNCFYPDGERKWSTNFEYFSSLKAPQKNTPIEINILKKGSGFEVIFKEIDSKFDCSELIYDDLLHYIQKVIVENTTLTLNAIIMDINESSSKIKLRLIQEGEVDITSDSLRFSAIDTIQVNDIYLINANKLDQKIIIKIEPSNKPTNSKLKDSEHLLTDEQLINSDLWKKI